MSSHSLISASSFKRTIECPGSFRETQKLGGGSNRTSSFAAEGTVAHHISEIALKGKSDLSSFDGKTITIDGHPITVDKEMVEMADLYVGFIETLRALGYHVWLEQRVSPNWVWSPNKPPVDLFGTADCIAYHPGLQHLVVCDLKYGRGIAVEVLDNPQFLYYATGVIAALPDLMEKAGWNKGVYQLSTVELVVIQPRAPHPDGPVRRHTYSTDQIVDWAQTVLYKAVERATKDPAAPLKGGAHCKFCPVASSCPELERMAQDAARAAFAEIEGTPPSTTLEQRLDMAETLELWIGAVRQDAHTKLEAGVDVPGWKLVPKRATRKWRNEDAVAEIVEHLPAKDTHEPPTVRSPAQLLSLKAVKADADLKRRLLDQVTSVSTGTTLTRSSDPRPAVPARGTAKDAFSDDALDTEDNGI